jgi:endonuclease/exonuclease/phosphatase family metal-dependent hydrolase
VNVRIASYNIRKAIGLDWRRDPERILDVLAEIGADIVVLQEADRRTGTRAGVLPLERLEEDLGLRLVEVAMRPLSHGWHGNAILIRERFDLQLATRVPLPHVDPRGAVRAVLAPEPLEIIGAHLGLTPGVRRRQFAKLVARLQRAPHPCILAGDFNEWNDANLACSGRLRLVTPGPSYHATRPVGALDRFLTTPDIRVRAAFVHRSALARRASDHLPVVMDFTLGDTP